VRQKKHMRCLSLWSSCPFTRRGSLFAHSPPSLPPSITKKENCAKTVRSLCTHSVLHRNHDWITSMIPMKVQEKIIRNPYYSLSLNSGANFFRSQFFSFRRHESIDTWKGLKVARAEDALKGRVRGRILNISSVNTGLLRVWTSAHFNWRSCPLSPCRQRSLPN